MKRPQRKLSPGDIRRYIDLYHDGWMRRFGVRFDDRWSGINFQYSWDIVISKN